MNGIECADASINVVFACGGVMDFVWQLGVVVVGGRPLDRSL